MTLPRAGRRVLDCDIIAKAYAHPPKTVAELQDRGIRVALYTAYLSSDMATGRIHGADAAICDRNLKDTIMTTNSGIWTGWNNFCSSGDCAITGRYAQISRPMPRTCRRCCTGRQCVNW